MGLRFPRSRAFTRAWVIFLFGSRVHSTLYSCIYWIHLQIQLNALEMTRIGLSVACVWALIGLVSVNGELYTASNDLVSTFHLEQQVVNVLGELVSKAEAKINAIRKYLKDYESIVEEKTSSEDEFMERVAGKLTTLSPFVYLFTRHVWITIRK